MASNRNEKELIQEYKNMYIRSKSFLKFYLIVFIIMLIIGVVLTITNISDEINAYFITGIVVTGMGILFTIVSLLCLKYVNKKLKKFNSTDN